MPDAPVLVVAWGNPLREDDGVAWHVLEALRRLRPRPGRPPLHLRHAHQLTPELADPVSRAAGVVFVDARRDGTAGEVRCEAVQPAVGANPLAHSLSPQALLLYAEALYGRAPQAVVVSVAGERFGMGEQLSPTVRRAVPRATRTVLRQARAWVLSPQPIESSGLP
ncbi:MAG TPA: hydrogenase maturation protease [Vicinamibacteria bacterium]|nr:hydrogenase maturation protease [Vicinamibacteria bacterium]